ncbi:MAG TPA: 2-C-methyl-D-erythritol 4-phosphate cytidylyltransferase [Acidimicrobiaceae bacterium]|nr:2-C-methyl-D-erythritol 4-phosphate cytidylyltransferase [Acidimicrobiaceae bacterium]HAQ24124.1 2-C-methyl-D-erythritol 4-phosphate cytidylyltransferase [Acidimicrobiaceae bacterium]HCV34113.1 2-C-methyl-D-erythritol 4-phosphate cytidylyltransferase [Acidimicrobiaceae bacterium]|tara:strand:+ start:1446 stop:2111 length:666 start_codon:yes stop_codon:yes gene_type:complete
MSVWTVVVAAGRGERFGGDKQVADLGGRPVVAHSVSAAAQASDGVVVVVAANKRTEALILLEGLDGVAAVVNGGATRSASVRSGLAAVPHDAEIVLIHDGARPLASAALFARVVAAVRAGADAVVPGVPVADSLRATDGSVVDRGGLIAVQTPQGFRADRLRSAHVGCDDASDDATLVEAAGGTVVIVDGEAANLKITRPIDLVLAGGALGVVDRGGGDHG